MLAMTILVTHSYSVMGHGRNICSYHVKAWLPCLIARKPSLLGKNGVLLFALSRYVFSPAEANSGDPAPDSHRHAIRHIYGISEGKFLLLVESMLYSLQSFTEASIQEKPCR
jgi:hypothetical protein